jgi:hypothetical protein
MIMVAVAVVQICLRFSAFVAMKGDVTWGVGTALFCSIVSPVIFHLYFSEKDKKKRNKWVLFVGMTVDILGFGVAANAVGGTTTADALLFASVVVQWCGWLYPHLVK